MKHIVDSIETFLIESAIAAFYKLIDDYKVLEKLGVGGNENKHDPAVDRCIPILMRLT